MQKQAGTKPSKIKSKLVLPVDLNIIWRYGVDLSTSASGWEVNSDLNTDKYWAVLLEK